MIARLPPLNALRAFEATARHLSVKAAARELHVTPAAISHQIKGLEDYLAVKLFRRLNRALELTDAGRILLPKLREGFESIAAAVERLRAHQGGGALTVSAAPSFAARWLMPRLHRFFAAHPEIDVRVSARMRQVSERSAEVKPDRASALAWLEDSDVAIVYGSGNYPELSADKLVDLTVTPLCSPRIIDLAHPLREPADLSRHTLIHEDTGEFFDGQPFWDAWLKAAGAPAVDSSRGPHFSHAVLALEAAADGLGVVASMPVLAADELARGKLVMPFALQVPLASAYYLVSARDAAARPAVAAFRAWLLAEAQR